MKQLFPTLLLFFTLSVSAQTTVVTGPKKKQQTTAVDANKRKAEAEAAAKKRAEAAAAKRKEKAQQEQLRKQRAEQTRQEQLQREQTEREEQLRQEQETARQKAEAEAKQKAEAEARDKAILLERARPYLDELANNMVYVEGGTFMMGATSEQVSDAWNNEKPAHNVKLSSFYICKYEVTQDLWEVIIGNNPSEFKGAKRPVEQVSWDDCQTFISRLNWLTGKRYRLPTEAEWEFAARGGNKSQGNKYSGSNSVKKVAWLGSAKSGTHDVGLKNPNELGLYDMSGNVNEWCLDCDGDYQSSFQTNPIGTGIKKDSARVLRGGAWYDVARHCRVSRRVSVKPDNRSSGWGLRLVLSE